MDAVSADLDSEMDEDGVGEEGGETNGFVAICPWGVEAKYRDGRFSYLF